MIVARTECFTEQSGERHPGHEQTDTGNDDGETGAEASYEPEVLGPASGRRNRAWQPTAVVMCGGGHGAYDIVRALGHAGIDSAVLVSHRDDVALRSRYVRRTCPLPEFHSRNFPQILTRVAAFGASCRHRPVLFYVGDNEAAFVSRFEGVLRRWYRFLAPPHALLAAVTSKARFAVLARDALLPVPETRVFMDSAELARAIDTVPLPCIVKPARNQDWFWETEALRERYGSYKSALRRFDRRTDLIAFCAGLPRSAEGFIVQEYIEGPDDRLVSFHGFLDEHSRCLGHFLTREIRTHPPHTGDTTCCETFRDDDLVRESGVWLARIGYQGIVKIDYKWDERTRTYRMLEIEPHYQTAHGLGASAGVNLPLLAYAHARGEAIAPPRRHRERVRLLDFRLDLKSYWRGYRTTGEWNTWTYARSLLHRGTYYRLYDPRDPAPFLYSASRYVMQRLGFLAPPWSTPAIGDAAGSSGAGTAYPAPTHATRRQEPPADEHGDGVRRILRKR